MKTRTNPEIHQKTFENVISRIFFYINHVFFYVYQKGISLNIVNIIWQP